MRKSPIKHKVSSYTRKGKRVSAYTRGSGNKQTKKIANPKIKTMNQQERLGEFLDEAFAKGYGNQEFSDYVYEGYDDPELDRLMKKWGVTWKTLENHMESDQ